MLQAGSSSNRTTISYSSCEAILTQTEIILGATGKTLSECITRFRIETEPRSVLNN